MHVQTHFRLLLLSAVINAAGRACWEGFISDQPQLRHQICVVPLALLHSSVPKLYGMATHQDPSTSALSRKARNSPKRKVLAYVEAMCSSSCSKIPSFDQVLAVKVVIVFQTFMLIRFLSYAC